MVEISMDTGIFSVAEPWLFMIIDFTLLPESPIPVTLELFNNQI